MLEKRYRTGCEMHTILDYSERTQVQNRSFYTIKDSICTIRRQIIRNINVLIKKIVKLVKNNSSYRPFTLQRKLVLMRF